MCATLSLVGMDIHEQHVGEREGAEELDNVAHVENGHARATIHEQHVREQVCELVSTA